MKKTLAALALTTALVSPVFAADVTSPTKAPASPYTFAYPINGNGLIISVFTEGGGSSVNGSAPGVPPASLTTTTAGIGGTLGYMKKVNSAISVSFEGDIEAQNFNGNSQGLSVQGPLRFEERVMIYAPWQQVFAALPNLWNPFTSISPFTLPTGFTPVGNALLGLGVYATEADISSAFAGVQSNKVWRANPGLVAMNVQPVTSGGAFREFVKWDFLSTSTIFGQVPKGGVTTATLGGNGVRAGVGYAF